MPPKPAPSTPASSPDPSAADRGARAGSEAGSNGASHRVMIAAAAAQVRRARERSSPPGDSGAAMPDSIPGYQIVREVHRGAQGVVYQAVQRNTQRHVAIKVMREGPFAGPSELGRFEREVQLLGQLDHPNIVGIHDRGVASGSHYLVMDYIRGLPLDAYLSTVRPPLRGALELFAGICEAVHAAHLRGIIHRDLKPGNIRIDEAGQPHILDFGLARSLWSGGDGPAEGAVATITGQFVGSIPWASPEQAEGLPARIDLRTDVYSLGVILYQILTDRFPYDVNGPVREVMERIISAEPPRPSSAISRASGTGRLDDELDTIALKALDKARQRRYQSAGELGADVRRYLAGEPIDAKRDSRAYVLRKQLRRHRVAVAVASGFVLLLAAGLIVSLALWRSAERHRAAAETNLARAEAASAEAVAQARAAREQAKRAARVTDLLRQIFNSTDPKSGGDRSLTALQVLSRGADRVLERIDGEPEIEAELLMVLGDIFSHLGDTERARGLLNRSLKFWQTDPAAYADRLSATAMDLGYLEEQAGDLVAAETQFRAAYEIVRSRMDPENWHVGSALVRTLRSRGDYAGVEAILRPEIERMRTGGGDASVRVIWLSHLAEALDAQKRPAEAVPLMREAMELSGTLPPYLTDVKWAVKNNLAWLLANTGSADEALPLAAEVLAWRRKSLPPEHLDIASSMLVLGTAKMRSGDAAGGLPLIEEAYTRRAAALKPDDDRVIQSRELLEECRRAARQ